MPAGKPLRLVLSLLAIPFLFVTSSYLASQSTRPAITLLQIMVVESPSEAQEILERLKRGEDFATLARERSVDPSAPDGGYLGKVEPSALRVEIRDALKGVGPGHLTQVVKIPAG